MNRFPNVFIGAVSRTPLGSFEGGLKSLTAPQLGSLAIKSVLEKAGIDGDQGLGVFSYFYNYNFSSE